MADIYKFGSFTAAQAFAGVGGPNPLVAKLEQRDRLSDEEKAVLARAIARVREVAAGKDIVQEGERLTESKLLLEGFAGRYKTLKGGGRQIVSIHIPGDFVDLHSFLLKTMEQGVVALTPCTVANIPHEALRAITDSHPHLTRLLWLSTLIDGAVHREWLVSMGRRSTLGHVAHLLCETFLRLQVVGMTEGLSFRLPLTQTELADVLGLSLVHTNRVIQEMRREGLVTWSGGTVTINDWKRLAQVAEFDPTYLHLHREPR